MQDENMRRQRRRPSNGSDCSSHSNSIVLNSEVHSHIVDKNDGSVSFVVESRVDISH